MNFNHLSVKFQLDKFQFAGIIKIVLAIMDKKDAIKITSSLHKEISTSVIANSKKYLILTEDIDPEMKKINTKVYLGGKILLSKTLDCSDIMSKPDYQRNMLELIYNQHEMLASMIRKGRTRKVKTPSNYLKEVKDFLQRRNTKSALELLTYGLKQYPDEPFLLSYYGCLESIVHKNYSYGIDTCKRAIELLNEKMPFGQDFFYPIFYLNLGRAYLSSDDKKRAFEALQKGLSYDKDNKDILWEMTKLGKRKKPVIPYLKRTNPLNKYIGRILHELSKSSV